MEKLREFIENKKEKSSSRRPRYGTRKLSVGLVSCVLGYCIFLSPTVVSAQVEEGASEVGSSISIETSAEAASGETESTETKETETVESPADETKETEAVAEVKETEAPAEEISEAVVKEREASQVLEEKAAEVRKEREDADQAMPREEALLENNEEEVAEETIENKEALVEENEEAKIEEAREEQVDPLTEESVNEEELLLNEEVDSETIAAEARTEAKDISNEITNQYVAITEEGHQTPGTVKPDDGEAIGWEVSFTTPRGTIAGDYFTIDLSENLSLKGIEPDHENEYPIEINGKTVADGVRLDRSTIKYTFNENVNDERNVRVSVKGFAYVDKTKVPNTKDENFSIAVGDTKDEKTLKVEYGDTYYTEDKLNGISQFTEFNPETGEYTQVFYINPESETITTSTKDWAFGKVVMFIDGVTPDGTPSDVNYTEKDTTVSVQKLPAGTDVPSAIIENPVQTDEETIVKTTFRDGGIEIVFADNGDEQLRNNDIDSPYIVTVKSVAAPSETGNNLYSRATLYGDGNKFHIMDNSILTTEGDTDAQGEKVGYFKEHHVYYTKVDGVLQEDQTFTIHSSKTEGFDYDFYFTDKNEIEDFKFIKVDTDNLVENPAYNADGSLARGGYEVGKTKEVTYIYERDIKHGSFQEHHIYQTLDENGKVITEETVTKDGTETTGIDENEYSTSKKDQDGNVVTEEKDKDGYKLVEVKATNENSANLGVQFDGQGAETSGNYVNGEKLEVTYIYQKTEVKQTPIEETGKFQEHHIYITKDKDGKETGREVADGKVSGGTKDMTYETGKKEKDGFEFVRTETPVEEPTYNQDGEEARGNYKPGVKQEITYVYEKTETPLTPLEPATPIKDEDPKDPEEPKETTPLVPLTPVEPVEPNESTPSTRDHKTPGTPVVTEVPSTPVVETEKTVEEKTEKTKEVENKEENVEEVKAVESEDEVVEKVEAREEDKNLAQISTKDDTKAPKTGDAGILSSIGLGSLAASGLAFIELKKRNKKNK